MLYNQIMQRGLLLALFILLAIGSLVFMVRGIITGNMITECEAGLVYKQGYCIDPVCSTGQVECEIIDNVMKPKPCVCVGVMGKILCGIKGQEETAAKSPLCKRRGQLNTICGMYNKTKDECVPLNNTL